MQVLEVYRLVEWFENEVIAGGIMDNYSDLDTAVERNVISTTKTLFEKEKKGFN